MEQYTIFDIIYEFDENQAHWENVLDNHERCTVLAYIREDALSPFEIPYRGGSKERMNTLRKYGAIMQQKSFTIWVLVTYGAKHVICFKKKNL